ncbi:ligase [Sulfolobus sp. A20]|uniref:lipoate--protein ligase family protein n=1 Tax=Sulfolobaceae TaxID=118883 RepID=UPI000845BF1F|nr:MULTISPECIES: lipoate--protein ligase family protein [unclassified Sulfolobus]TRM74290.1 lipoate--protein ligase family protein [Sulfolobus sp. A20-N-F8]TRM74832.1 lipoate--protein ligase family protein [Sulfolobus sp. E5]TRM85033.1 lipoate--protein ligase family protein [Sulfolobus sp. F3]TRM87263.1 lipoate--protein ligase family protein [Sulfolobus sp. E3]TRM98377.1 lipoate--protein ligase family protein [Sulfolobus sp. F1]
MSSLTGKSLFIKGSDLADTVAIPAAIIYETKRLNVPILVVTSAGKSGISLGYFQDVDTEVNLEEARKRDVEVIRRLGVGGGTIYSSKGSSMALFMTFPKDFFTSMDKAFCQIGSATVHAYYKLGVKGAWYDHIGDVRVGSPRAHKKITGFGFATVEEILILNMVIGVGKLNFEEMASVIKIPPEKFMDKTAKSVQEYVTSVEEETGRKPSDEEVYDAFKSSLEETLKIKLDSHEFSDQAKDIWKKYKDIAKSDQNLYLRSSAKRFSNIPKGYSLGFSRYKARKLIVTHLLTDGKEIKDVMISGDFYCSPGEYLFELEQKLRGMSIEDKEKILATINEIFSRKNFEMPSVKAEDILESISRAIEDAKKRL